MPTKRSATRRKPSAPGGILLRYRDRDTAYGVTRRTTAKLAETLGLSETQVVHVALANLLDGVRTAGVPHDAESLDSSDLILPMADATLGEVKDMLHGDGLIPG